jgi:hypothetical protein
MGCPLVKLGPTIDQLSFHPHDLLYPLLSDSSALPVNRHRLVLQLLVL